MIKSREATLLSSHHLRQFVMAYDAQRQCNEQCLENQNFIFPIVVPDLPLRESSLPSDSVGKEDDTTISERSVLITHLLITLPCGSVFVKL